MRQHPEVKLLRIAGRQYSVFSRKQALDVGTSPKQIDWHLARELWIPMHRGVYLPCGVPVGLQQRVMAANLACGTGAVASYDSAAVVWGFSTNLELPHVTVPDGRGRRRPGIVVHRALKLEVVTHQRFRVTSPMRTITDLADVWHEERLERALDNAHRRRLVDPAAFAAYLRRPENTSRPGTAALREMVAVRDPSRPIGSDLETLLFRALRKAHLPLPVPQHPVRTRKGVRYIDFAYPEQRLAIELDGFEEHGTRRAFEADRLRQNELEELGYRFRRSTWTQLRTDPAAVAVTVGSGLGLVPTRWGPPAGRGRRARAAPDATGPPLRTRRRA